MAAKKSVAGYKTILVAWAEVGASYTCAGGRLHTSSKAECRNTVAAAILASERNDARVEMIGGKSVV